MMGEYEADHCKASFNEGRRYMLRQILNYAKPVENGEFSDVTLEFFEELTNWSR